jgi:acyl-CoA reductase-like NAD-dependent aldehyde dehydrogenase
MALSELERVWRAWLALNMADRARFLHLFREAYRQEREERLAANRRATGEPVTASDFDRMTLAALDFEARV